MNSQRITYAVEELIPYIDWVYFFHAWGFKPAERECAEAAQLFHEAGRLLNELNGSLTVQSLFRLCAAYADGDNLIAEGITIPLLRQQTPHADGSPYLCLSDFVRPLTTGRPDTIGVFASSVKTLTIHETDPYRSLLVETLADRLVEAATEKMHLHVRRETWGYAPHETLSIPDLLAGKYQGIRPAVGYPSLPDQSINFLIDRLLDMKQIGITLTENGAMQPHASVCGLMFYHPAARYFSVGRIDDHQLNDYARRRGMSVGQMRKFLERNLST